MSIGDRRVFEVKSATARYLSALWSSNFEANRNAVAKNQGINSIKDKFPGIPAVLVGAGPSLEKNLKLLSWAAGRSIVIVCDAILKSVTELGIRPAFVVTLDPQESISHFFNGVDTSDLVLVAASITHPKVISQWKGKVVFYHKYAPDIPVLTNISKEIPHIGYLTPGGTVLSIAYDLAFRIGADPIVFVGQDLSYPEETVYAKGTVYGDYSLDAAIGHQGTNIVYEKDIFGRDLPTIKSMAVTKQWMEWAFSTWKREPPPKIYNCTEGGILTRHCTIAPFADVLFRYCTKPVNVKWMLKKRLK